MATPSPSTALAVLERAADDGRLAEVARRHHVRLLGVFGSAARDEPAVPPGDLDVAVSFAADDGDAPAYDQAAIARATVALLDDLVALTGYDGVDLVVLDGAEPVLRSEALCGTGLYERTAGLWATEQMAALAQRWDTAWLRRLDLEAMQRSQA